MNNNKAIHQVTVENLSVRYNKKQKYISNNISFSINAGEVMAIMGPSGSGKSTLLKAILGTIPLEKDKGKIFINGHEKSKKALSCIKHKVGYVPQDDILVNELTIKENLKSFHTIAVDSDYDDKEVDKKIDIILNDLNLNVKEQLSNKKIHEISGGQRKRVNIAMELINEPDILIIDEPTSGLSSLDSLELLDYLRRYARTGKMVIIIIHQPSSDVYKMFDNLLLLDNTGTCVFSGKKESLNSIKAYDYRTYPDKIMLSIEENTIIKSLNNRIDEKKPLEEKPKLRHLNESAKDFYALLKRNFLIKTRDKMSQLITFLAPPILGILIGIVFKFTAEDSEYDFSLNILYEQFLFMMIISGMFLGFVGSVMEVIRDRGILERESLRGLSISSYYFSKLLINYLFGTFQGLLFVLASLWMLEATDLLFPNIIVMLFTIYLSISIGLLISMLVKTSVSAYNLIPLILIPQIILGGAFLPFSNMGKEIYLWEDRGSQMPLMAKIMPASWLYEFAMTLNYEYSDVEELEKNINLIQLEANNEDDFLSLTKSQIFPTYFLEVLELDDKKNMTFIYNINILLFFLLFFIISGWLLIRKPYIRKDKLIISAQFVLFLVFVLLPNYLVESNEMIENKNTNKTYQISKDQKFWYEADAYCRNLNMTLPSIDELVELSNTNNIPKTMYWTSSKYSKNKSAYWTLDFSKYKNSDFPLDINKVKNSAKSLVAYNQKSITTQAICIKNK